MAEEALANPEEDNGGTVLATTGRAEGGGAADILHAYQAQTTTVDPGVRWIKHPAAIAPVWLEQPARLAALARRTVSGLRVYSRIPRQVRLSRRPHDPPSPGHKGTTATPTAAGAVALVAPVALVRFSRGDQAMEQRDGVQPPHLRRCDALGLDASGDAVPSTQKNGRGS